MFSHWHSTLAKIPQYCWSWRWWFIDESSSIEKPLLCGPTQYLVYHNCNKVPDLCLEHTKKLHCYLDPSFDNKRIQRSLSSGVLLMLKMANYTCWWSAMSYQRINNAEHLKKCAYWMQLHWVSCSYFFRDFPSKEAFLVFDFTPSIGDSDVWFKTHSNFSGCCILRFENYTLIPVFLSRPERSG